jgi:hypothetical protein
MMEERRPLYSFEAPEPVERGDGSLAKIFLALGLLIAVPMLIATFAGHGNRQNQQPTLSPAKQAALKVSTGPDWDRGYDYGQVSGMRASCTPMAGDTAEWVKGCEAARSGGGPRPVQVQQRTEPSPEHVGPRPVDCPAQYRSSNFKRCTAIDLPAIGDWVRRVSVNGVWGVANFSGVQARGCNGEIYALATTNSGFNETCGYFDYRSTDHTSHTIIEGHDPS